MDEAALDALIDAGTTMLGIEMKPEWRQAVRMHLGISLGHAATVLDTPLSDHLDPAPVFRA
jgi:1-carboxybiuret hydrolase subunit AtzG-like protein